MAEKAKLLYPRPYNRHEWQVVILFFLSYLAVYIIAAHYLPLSVELYPASAIALCAMFFGGVRLWPVVYLAALASAAFTNMPWPLFIALPVAEVLQSLAGASMLRAVGVDPLFRRYRDFFYLIATVLIISCITPTLRAFVSSLHGASYSVALWGREYTATAFCLLIITPFLLRWCAKFRFSRRPLEIAETVAVFAVLITIDIALFIKGVSTVLGIPLVYALLLPLFLIALRLRPRFTTLAFFITALMAVAGALAGVEPGGLTTTLFEIEILLMILAVLFFVIVSLEEDRRLNTNLMRSQLAMLENAVARVGSESQAKNDFIAILGHELRNPLAPVVSAIDILKLKEGRDAEETNTLNMMSDRMDTVRRLLDDLLDISRITEGKMVLKRQTLELEPVLKRAMLSTEHYRNELHQSLVYKPCVRELSLGGDPVRLEQIFSNLLANASKYSDEGDTVILSVRDLGSEVEIKIVDEGVGINKEALEGIFMPFRQVEQGERSIKGLGIGLALVRTFTLLHGGSVRAESRGAGLGSSFIVRLPLLSTAHAPQVSPDENSIRTSSTPSAAKKLSVLVVDDNDMAAAGIGRLLELQGCSVSYAYNGKQALQRALMLAPDVIILDIGLPDGDGYAVAKTMRARGFKGRLIALTGYGTSDAKEIGKEAGFGHYLVKPASLSDLRRVLPELN